jgi:hypothetical protein
MDAGVRHPTLFTRNRDRLLEANVARESLAALLGPARVRRLLSDEHFAVDGTLIEARASMKSVRRGAGSTGSRCGPSARPRSEYATRINQDHQ